MAGRAMLTMPRLAMSTKKTRHLVWESKLAIAIIAYAYMSYSIANVARDAVRFNEVEVITIGVSLL